MPKPIQELQTEVKDIQKQLKELVTLVSELKSMMNLPKVEDENKSTKIQDSTGWFW
tara:strand:+ start:240 stop:407 length:168 start_codon:yes stop_codon:yes gene_type:complete